MSRRAADGAPTRAKSTRSKKRLAADAAVAAQPFGAQVPCEPGPRSQPPVVLRLEDIFDVASPSECASAADASDVENGRTDVKRPAVARTFGKKGGSAPVRNTHRTLLFDRTRVAKG